MYTSGRNVKSRASKPAGLTIAKATAQARRIAANVMPGELVTVDSRRSHDLPTDTALIVTTVTFPSGNPNGPALYSELSYLADRFGNMPYDFDFSASRITITRRTDS